MTLRGTPTETAAQARAWVAACPSSGVLWVDDGAPVGAGTFHVVAPGGVRKLLGQAFDVVVLSLHRDVHPNVIAQCQGFIWEGGVLMLRLPPEGELPARLQERLVVHPFDASAVGTRFWRRVLDGLRASPAVIPPNPLPESTPHPVGGTAGQARVVDVLSDAMTAGRPALFTLTADRGRGKSSALGLAVHRALTHRPNLRVAVVAPSAEAATEVMRFAPEITRCMSAEEALPADGDVDVLVVDEAAQLPVGVLRALARRHASACVVFSTTVAGYEGTGRGFLLRFMEWCQAQPHAQEPLQLSEPIRWGENDPLESLVSDLLLMRARPAEVGETIPSTSALVAATLDRDALARDEAMLQQFFGLLVHAHYRTTPSDLQRALDAPNLELHAVLWERSVVAACLVAREGAFPEELCHAMAHGATRVKGHALADTLVSHCATPAAGTLRMIRSVRIAVHPSFRRHGVASMLVDHVHRAHPEAELFGTLFGATPELLRFRRSLGYRLVRLGVSTGDRSGEPTAVMVRPVTARAEEMVERWQRALAWGLPEQLALLRASPLTEPDDALVAELTTGTPLVEPPTRAELLEVLERYCDGIQPVEPVAFAVRWLMESHPDAVTTLTEAQRALLTSRVQLRRSWEETGKNALGQGASAAMRAMRPAIRALLDAVKR
ncbi:MAG: GNAT family N-acetyltransferase [Myxococcota bacterium]